LWFFLVYNTEDPPGTGKTASLQDNALNKPKENTSHLGALMSLNSMEMHHLFEAYVKYSSEAAKTRFERIYEFFFIKNVFFFRKMTLLPHIHLTSS
jgi:hypothetical protein